MNQNPNRRNPERIQETCVYKDLSQSQLQMIQEALVAVGDFGEVRLVVEKGRIRYVIIQKSLDALSWQAEKSHF